MNTPNLSICITTWNSEKFLPGLFESIFKQTVLQKEDYPIKISINVVDSGSTDNSVDFLQKNYPEVHILKNTHNLGFCRSYNQAIRMSQSDFVLVLNADVILEEDYIEKLLEVIKKDEIRLGFKTQPNQNKKIGSVSGKLLRAKFINLNGTGLDDIEKTNVIDSFGLAMKKNRRFINIGEGEKDDGQYNKNSEVFGFSATAALYSRSALEQIKYENEYFDEDFFSYQEDIDLSWRLQIAGFKAIFAPNAQAYHFRSAQSGIKKYTNLKIAKSYKIKSKMIRFHSYKNHLLLLLKNETRRNFFKILFPILWYELRKLIYLLLFDWSTLKGIKYVIKLLPKMRAKRKYSFQHRRISAEKVRRWIA